MKYRIQYIPVKENENFGTESESRLNDVDTGSHTGRNPETRIVGRNSSFFATPEVFISGEVPTNAQFYAYTVQNPLSIISSYQTVPLAQTRKKHGSKTHLRPNEDDRETMKQVGENYMYTTPTTRYTLTDIAATAKQTFKKFLSSYDNRTEVSHNDRDYQQDQNINIHHLHSGDIKELISKAHKMQHNHSELKKHHWISRKDSATQPSEHYEIHDYHEQHPQVYLSDKKKKKEIHYHQHKHLHDHDHDQKHVHKHKSGHHHDHGHDHNQEHTHSHSHKGDHWHEHHEKNEHKHNDDHSHKHHGSHGHKHHEDHGHKHESDHQHGHKDDHDHYEDHKHEHGHKHHDDHNHHHGHDHMHKGKHSHHHHQHHKHGHKHHHKHSGKH